MTKKNILTIIGFLLFVGATILAGAPAPGYPGESTGEGIPRVVFHNPRGNEIWLGVKKVELALKGITPPSVQAVEIYIDGKLAREFKAPPYAFTYNFGQTPRNRTLKVLVRGRQNVILTSRGINSYQIDDFQEVEVSQLIVPVVVTDGRGNYINDLAKEDFKLYVDGSPQEITYFSRKGETKFNMVLLIDISSSMKDKIGKVKEAARTFLEQLMSRNDNAIVVFFNHEVFEDTDFTNNVDDLVGSLSVAFPFGATALYDAVAYCVKLLKSKPGQNIIVLLSDGEDNSSYIDPYTLIKKVERSNAVIYAIGRKTVGDYESQYQTLLKKISTSSGGVTFLLDDHHEIKKIYQKIQQDIKAKYILQFSQQNQRKLNRFRKITVKLKDKKRYRIRTIKGYYY